MKKLFILLLLLTPLLANALSSDRQQKVYIKSDSFSYNSITDTSIFTGNVTFTQGTTHLIASQVTIKRDSHHQLQLVIAKGKRAELWEKPQPDQPIVHAWGNTIKYFPKQNQVILIGKAEATQTDRNIQAPVIHYNTLTKTVTTPASAKGRTSIVIEPPKKKA